MVQFKKLGIDKQIDYDKFYLYSIITHSTAIEGSTVTEIENQLLFDEGISAKGRSMAEQLMNLDLKAAYEQSIAFAKNHNNITVEMLKQLSSLVLKNTGTSYQTALGEFSSDLCESINQRRKSISKANILECYKLSFDAHFQLVTIHPWADGNGRMCRLLMNQLQFEFGINPSYINKDRKAEYIEALIATRESDDIDLFRNFMFDEHIRNLERTIRMYRSSVEDDGYEYRVDVGINVGINEQRVLELIRKNNRITVKEVAESLSVSIRQGERVMALLKKKGRIIRVGSNKSGHWEIIE